MAENIRIHGSFTPSGIVIPPELLQDSQFSVQEFLRDAFAREHTMSEYDWLTSNDPWGMFYFVMGRSEGLEGNESLRLISRQKIGHLNDYIMEDLQYKDAGTAWRNFTKEDALKVCAIIRCIVGNPFRLIQVIPREEPSIWEAIPILAKAAKEKNYFCRSWVTPAVLGLAQTIYDDRDWDLFPILHDALLESGCDNETILHHCQGEEICTESKCKIAFGGGRYDQANHRCRSCRGTGWQKMNPLVRCRGDWLVDLILEKE